MADFTSKAIKETFISLINERPLSEITVKSIVEKCGINRNSFYYHYRDIPDLIEEIVKEDVEEIIIKYPSVSSIVECFDVMTEFASKRESAIMHIYRSVNREVFDRNLMSLSNYFVKKYVDTVLTDVNITDADKKTIITYYKSVCFGLVNEWLDSGMSQEFATEIRRIFLLKKDLAKEFAELLENQI